MTRHLHALPTPDDCREQLAGMVNDLLVADALDMATRLMKYARSVPSAFLVYVGDVEVRLEEAHRQLGA